MTRRSVMGCVVVALSLVSALATPAAATSAGAASDITAKLAVASTRVAAGTPLRGTLVLTNRGAHTVDLNAGCAPQWDVVLGRGRSAPGVAFSMECSPVPFLVAPGTTKRKFHVDTADRRAGRYRLFLVASESSFPEAKPVKVRIVNAH